MMDRMMPNIEGRKYCDIAGEMPFYYFLVEDSFEVMQYTGLKDKNGKEIYEGDIFLDITSPYGKECVVIFELGSFGFKQHGYFRSFYGCNKRWNAQTKESKIEIIGNIYENPELLDIKHKLEVEGDKE